MKKDEKGNKARVRVFFGEIEGDNETIRDGLHSIANAVNRTFQADHTIIKVINNLNEKKHLIEDSEEILKEAGLDISETDSNPTDNEEPRSKPQRNRKPQSYSHVGDLNLRPEGKTDLRTFFKEKSPADQQQKLVVVLYYLYRELGLQNITADHIYTALSDVGERVPPGIGAVLRNISNRKGWVDSSDSNAFKTTVHGDNFVKHDLPKIE